jgi:hypothetical protein
MGAVSKGIRQRSPRGVRAKASRIQRTVAVGIGRPSNFYEAAFDNFSHTFRDAVRVNRGPKGFRGEKNAAACKQQCLDEFNRGRDELIDIARDLTDQSELAKRLRARLPSLKKSTE